MWIELQNTHASVVRATQQELRWLSDFLSFKDARAHFRHGGGDGTVRMFNLATQKFHTGLMANVRKGAERDGIEIQLGDRRQRPCEPDPAADLGWLRDYQLAAVEAVKKRTRGIVKAATGAGKTEVAVGLTRAIPCRWLFLVHRSTLVEQTAERYARRTGLQAGVIGEGRWEVADRFTVATFQTLARALAKGDARAKHLLEQAQGIIVDECHVLPADSFLRVAMTARNAYWRVGLSGTPLDRDDRRSLLAIAALGRIIYEIESDVLIKAGVLARPTIRLMPVAQQIDKPTWQGVYGEGVVRSAKRNRAVVACVLRAEKPCLVFVKEIKHGQLLVKALEKAGVRSSFVWGSHETSQRQSAVKQLVRGDLDALVCSVVFQEGLDVPELRSVVIASGGKSVIAALQRIGRGMRRDDKTGKTTFEVFDIHDERCSRGCDHAGCRWMERHTRARTRAYAREKFETIVEASSLGGAA